MVSKKWMTSFTKPNNVSKVYSIKNIALDSLVEGNNTEIVLISDIGDIARYVLGTNRFYDSNTSTFVSRVYGKQQATIKFYRGSGSDGKYYMLVSDGGNTIRVYSTSPSLAEATLPNGAVEIPVCGVTTEYTSLPSLASVLGRNGLCSIVDFTNNEPTTLEEVDTFGYYRPNGYQSDMPYTVDASTRPLLFCSGWSGSKLYQILYKANQAIYIRFKGDASEQFSAWRVIETSPVS